MANRAYLFSLSNRPKSYDDRPETISGLSDWAYLIPFSHRVLMSGDPQRCSSLYSDGFDDDPPQAKTKLFAISSDFAIGFARLKRFCDVLRTVTANNSPDLTARLDQAIEFLAAHRDRYLLLETIEIDSMSESDEAALRNCVDAEMNRCLHVGAAIDALPANLSDAARCLQKATQQKDASPFDAFFGLRLDDNCDNRRDGQTEYPLGLEWSEVAYFQPLNKAQFAADQSATSPSTDGGSECEQIVDTVMHARHANATREETRLRLARFGYSASRADRTVEIVNSGFRSGLFTAIYGLVPAHNFLPSESALYEAAFERGKLNLHATVPGWALFLLRLGPALLAVVLGVVIYLVVR